MRIDITFIRDFEEWKLEFPTGTLEQFTKQRELVARAYREGAQEMYRKARLWEKKPKPVYDVYNPYSGDGMAIS